MRPLAIAGLLALSAVVAGCGTAADQDQARNAVERLYAAVKAQDGTTACAQLSPSLRAQLIKDESEPDCAKAVLKLDLKGERASAVRVFATSAQVDLADGDTVYVGDTDQGWRVEALGCHRKDGGPFECEEAS